MLDRPAIRTVDYHTAGEPFRIVVDGLPVAEGATVLDRRSWAQTHLETARALLINEPRGHADMYGGFVTPPDDDDGDLGVVFFHKDGFSTACGHGTIALVTWAIESGQVAHEPGTAVEVTVDVPSGRLRCIAEVDTAGAVSGVRFWNVPSFVSATGIVVDTDYGAIETNVSFGGAFYGSVALEQLDLDVRAADLDRLIALARHIKAGIGGPTEAGAALAAAVTHPDDPRLSGMYGVIFHHDVGVDPLQQRNVTVFADGEVDRSPCGSGTSARLALLHHQGALVVGEQFRNGGITGEWFDARVESIVDSGPPTTMTTSVAGAAYRTAETTFTLDPRDPLGTGFLLR